MRLPRPRLRLRNRRSTQRGALRSPWKIVVVVMLLGGLIGGLVERRQPPRFTSTTAILLAPVSTYVDLDPANGAPPQVSVDTDARIAMSDAVLRQLADATGLTLEEVRESASLSAPPLSTVLRLSYTAGTRPSAAFGASVWADALLEERGRVLATSAAQYRRVLTEEVRRVRGVLALGELDPATTTTINEQVVRLETALQRLDRQGESAGRILTAAEPPLQPDRSDPQVPIAGGFMLGALVGVALMVVRRSRQQAGPGSDEATSIIDEQPYRRSSLIHDAIRYRRPSIAIGVVAGLVASLAMNGIIADRQEATAALTLSALPGNAYGQDLKRDQTEAIQNEAQSVRSDDVLSTAAALIGNGQTVIDLSRRIRVNVPPRSTTVRVTYTGADAETAATNAQHVLDAFIAYREQRAQDAIQIRLEGLSGQISDVATRLQESLATIATGTANQQAYQHLLAVSLSQRLLSLDSERLRVAALPSSAGRAVEPVATGAGGQSSPLVLAFPGVLAGLAAGLMLAIYRERHRDAVRRTSDIEGNGIPVFASEPYRRHLSLFDRDDFARRAVGALLRRNPPPLRLALVPVSPDIDGRALATHLAVAFEHLGHDARVLDLTSSAIPEHPGAVSIVVGGSPEADQAWILPESDLVVAVLALHDTRHGELEFARRQLSDMGHGIDGVLCLASSHIDLQPAADDESPLVAPVTMDESST